MMPQNSYYIVMTHNHQLDLEICTEILKKADFAFLGLIGSDTKWARFQSKLKQSLKRLDKNEAEALIQRIVCPVGLSAIPGKLPMEVAVSIAGQLIAFYQSQESMENAQRRPRIQGLSWPELSVLSKNLLVQE